MVSGGGHANKQKGISGSIHDGRIARRHPELTKQIREVILEILEVAFGNKLWYRRQVHLCQKLNQQSGEERTIGPASGFWLSTRPKHEAVHCDYNICGAIFVLSTYSSTAGTAALCHLSEAGNVGKCHLVPGMVVGGTWGSRAHANNKVDATVMQERMSWNIYIDKRVFGSNYVCL